MNSDLRQQLVNELRNARKVRVDGKLYIGEHPDISEAGLKAALNRGATVTENGVSRWLEFFPVHDSTKEGSSAYTWARGGNKVRTEKVLFTKDAQGNVTHTSQGFVWRTLD